MSIFGFGGARGPHLEENAAFDEAIKARLPTGYLGGELTEEQSRNHFLIAKEALKKQNITTAEELGDGYFCVGFKDSQISYYHRTDKVKSFSQDLRMFTESADAVDSLFKWASTSFTSATKGRQTFSYVIDRTDPHAMRCQKGDPKGVKPLERGKSKALNNLPKTKEEVAKSIAQVHCKLQPGERAKALTGQCFVDFFQDKFRKKVDQRTLNKQRAFLTLINPTVRQKKEAILERAIQRKAPQEALFNQKNTDLSAKKQERDQLAERVGQKQGELQAEADEGNKGRILAELDGLNGELNEANQEVERLEKDTRIVGQKLSKLQQACQIAGSEVNECLQIEKALRVATDKGSVISWVEDRVGKLTSELRRLSDNPTEEESAEPELLESKKAELEKEKGILSTALEQLDDPEQDKIEKVIKEIGSVLQPIRESYEKDKARHLKRVEELNAREQSLETMDAGPDREDEADAIARLKNELRDETARLTKVKEQHTGLMGVSAALKADSVEVLSRAVNRLNSWFKEMQRSAHTISDELKDEAKEIKGRVEFLEELRNRFKGVDQYALSVAMAARGMEDVEEQEKLVKELVSSDIRSRSQASVEKAAGVWNKVKKVVGWGENTDPLLYSDGSFVRKYDAWCRPVGLPSSRGYKTKIGRRKEWVDQVDYLHDVVGLLHQDKTSYGRVCKQRGVLQKSEGIEDVLLREAMDFASREEGEAYSAEKLKKSALFFHTKTKADDDLLEELNVDLDEVAELAEAAVSRVAEEDLAPPTTTNPEERAQEIGAEIHVLRKEKVDFDYATAEAEVNPSQERVPLIARVFKAGLETIGDASMLGLIGSGIGDVASGLKGSMVLAKRAVQEPLIPAVALGALATTWQMAPDYIPVIQENPALCVAIMSVAMQFVKREQSDESRVVSVKRKLRKAVPLAMFGAMMYATYLHMVTQGDSFAEDNSYASNLLGYTEEFAQQNMPSVAAGIQQVGKTFLENPVLGLFCAQKLGRLFDTAEQESSRRGCLGRVFSRFAKALRPLAQVAEDVSAASLASRLSSYGSGFKQYFGSNGSTIEVIDDFDPPEIVPGPTPIPPM